MSGHKRVNARPVCPEVVTPARKSPRMVPEVVIPVREPRKVSLPKTKKEPPLSPVPTILYDEDYGKDEQIPSQSTIPISPNNSLGSITRSFTLGQPIASMFAVPKGKVDRAQRRAVEQGLFNGTVYRPKMLEEEESEYFLITGHDPKAVDSLLESQERDVERRLRLPGEMAVVKTASRGLSWFQVVLAGAVGGFAMYYCLISL
jgi:hypothetical protein